MGTQSVATVVSTRLRHAVTPGEKPGVGARGRVGRWQGLHVASVCFGMFIAITAATSVAITSKGDMLSLQHLHFAPRTWKHFSHGTRSRALFRVSSPQGLLPPRKGSMRHRIWSQGLSSFVAPLLQLDQLQFLCEIQNSWCFFMRFNTV